MNNENEFMTNNTSIPVRTLIARNKLARRQRCLASVLAKNLFHKIIAATSPTRPVIIDEPTMPCAHCMDIPLHVRCKRDRRAF